MCNDVALNTVNICDKSNEVTGSKLLFINFILGWTSY